MDRERISSIHKVRSPDNVWNDSTMDYLDQLFTGRHWWPSQERAKTPQELKIIHTVVTHLEKYLAKYGAKPLQILAHHIQIVDKTKMDAETRAFFDERVKNEKGVFNVRAQRVAIPDWKVKSGLDFALVLVHELVHFYSFASFGKKENNELGDAQVGLHVFRDDGEQLKEYFADLNEAVTEELTRRFFDELRRIPSLREEINTVMSTRQKANDQDISSVSMWSEMQDDGEELYFAKINTFAYKESRERLYALIDEIDKNNPGRFESKDVIFAVFACAAMTGDVKEMATLVEGLGRGRLRELAKKRPE